MINTSSRTATLRLVIMTFGLLALAGTSFAVTVAVSTPGNGAKVASPVTIKASASSSNVITGWHVYVDDNDVYSGGESSSISASVSMATGSHSVIVRAWDSTGAYGSADLSLTVGAAGGGSGVTVAVSSPANGAAVSSPATFNASAASGYTITAWTIYVDGASAYTAGATSTISAPVSMSSGSHSVNGSGYEVSRLKVTDLTTGGVMQDQSDLGTFSAVESHGDSIDIQGDVSGGSTVSAKYQNVSIIRW
jgi:hypothetical protein